MEFISREQLITATRAWLEDKDRPIGEILVEQEALTHGDAEVTICASGTMLRAATPASN